MNDIAQPRSINWIVESRKAARMPHREEGTFLWPSEKPAKPVKVSRSSRRTRRHR